MTDKPKNPWPSGKFGRPGAPPGDLVDQFEPGYAFRETGLWNGMTREETTAWLEEMRKESEQRRRLYHFEPDGPEN